MTADILWLFIAFFFALLFMWGLFALHKDPGVEFDLTDILKKNGKVSRTAIIELAAFLATTFVLIHQELEQTLTDWYVAAYGTFWIAKGVVQILKGTPPSTPENPQEGKA